MKIAHLLLWLVICSALHSYGQSSHIPVSYAYTGISAYTQHSADAFSFLKRPPLKLIARLLLEMTPPLRSSGPEPVIEDALRSRFVAEMAFAVPREDGGEAICWIVYARRGLAAG